MVRVTKCAIVSRPADPAPERDLRYTIRLHTGDGLSQEIQNVRSAVVQWAEFDCFPAAQVGEEGHPEGGHLVLWVGDSWYPLIHHRPATLDCPPPSPGDSVSSPETPQGSSLAGIEDLSGDLAPPGQMSLSRPLGAPQEAVPMIFSARDDDLDLSILDAAVVLDHPGAAYLRASLQEQDTSDAWGSAVVVLEHQLEGADPDDWIEIDTETRWTTAGGMKTTTPQDVRALRRSRVRVSTKSSTSGKRARVILQADRGPT